NTKHNLALRYQTQGKIAQAEPLYREVLKVRTARLGANHPDTLAIKNNLAAICQSLGHPDQAEPLLEELLASCIATLGADHPDTLITQNKLAALYQDQGKYPEAEKTLRDCLAVCVKKQPDEWTTFHTRSLLGDALLGQKKYAAAEPLLKGAYNGLKQ